MDRLLSEEHIVTLRQAILYEEKELLSLLLLDCSESKYFPKILHVTHLKWLVMVSSNKDQKVQPLSQ